MLRLHRKRVHEIKDLELQELAQRFASSPMDQIDHATIRLKFWPSPQDYNEAVQNPARSFSSPELQNAEPELDNLGLPRPVTGGFASVYHFHSRDSEWAVRCFLQRIQDQESRYATISKFILSDSLPYTVDFEYMPDGIRVMGESFPLLKMDWVHGETLDAYIQKHCQSKERMERLSQEFLYMLDQLNKAGIAHGDLQHGNILITDQQELRLVDYDGMFVPGMEGMKATELGHPNYQHPKRSAEHFNRHLDNFSALIIHTSLTAISQKPELLQKLGGLNDCLLFRAADFREPLSSSAFRELEHHGTAELLHLSQLIRCYLEAEPDSIPPLQQLPQQLPFRPAPLHPPQYHQPKSQANSKATESGAKWWEGQEFDREAAAIHASNQPNQPTFKGVFEPELQILPPRKCHFNWSRSLFHPVFAQMLLMIIPHVWVFGIMPLAGYLTSETVQGTVIESKAVDSPKTAGEITYKYTINGRQYEGTIVRNLVTSDLTEHPVGSHVTVHDSWLLPGDEFMRSVDGLKGAFVPWFMALVVVCIAALISYKLIWYRPLRDRWLAKYGKPASGNIYSKEITTGNKGAKIYNVSYHFTANNRPQTASTTVLTTEYDSVKPGQQVTILFNPEKPSTSVIYRFSRYKATK